SKMSGERAANIANLYVLPPFAPQLDDHFRDDIALLLGERGFFVEGLVLRLRSGQERVVVGLEHQTNIGAVALHVRASYWLRGPKIRIAPQILVHLDRVGFARGLTLGDARAVLSDLVLEQLAEDVSALVRVHLIALRNCPDFSGQFFRSEIEGIFPLNF